MSQSSRIAWKNLRSSYTSVILTYTLVAYGYASHPVTEQPWPGAIFIKHNIEKGLVFLPVQNHFLLWLKPPVFKTVTTASVQYVSLFSVLLVPVEEPEFLVQHAHRLKDIEEVFPQV